MRKLIAVFGLFSLAACGSGFDLPLDNSRMATGSIPASGSQSIAPVSRDGAAAGNQDISAALFYLPIEAGVVTAVRERNFVDGTRQEIALAPDRLTKGENVIEVSLRASSSSVGGPGQMQMGKPSERGVRSEILSRFPEVRMGIVTRAMSNAYGPVGLAIGKHANGARCVFAWQWIDDIRQAGGAGSSGFARLGALVSGGAAPASIRVRICRGDQTVDQLAAMVEGLRLGESSTLARIMSMDRRNILPDSVATVSGSTAAVTALPDSLEATLIGSPAPETKAKPAAPPRRAARPAPRFKRVARRPAPRSDDDGTPAAAFNAAQAYQSPVAPGGPRYMAPVAGAEAGTTPPPAAYPAQAQAQFGAGLPPQAFRGPTGR